MKSGTKIEQDHCCPQAFGGNSCISLDPETPMIRRYVSGENYLSAAGILGSLKLTDGF
jgi:hypothetical protein